ncbi:MAG TPA: prepilin-type N-terminal cleavage/methylation domain-containing protein [Firmicutes bacterium]|jgi:prepilin-type N-terminal cleavage/methylation domain-containing protein|nr:prepilin-type N-terminal cleavage/methylation domain-containing protein [Bacillota bacterium]
MIVLKKNRKGFTFIELVITLALLGLLLAIALPCLPALSNYRLEGAARKMAADLRLIKNEAISSGKACQIKFFVYDQSYYLYLADRNQIVRLPEGISFIGDTNFNKDSLNRPYVLFNVLGRPNMGGTVILGSRDGGRRYIILTPVTGRVRVSREQPKNW